MLRRRGGILWLCWAGLLLVPLVGCSEVFRPTSTDTQVGPPKPASESAERAAEKVLAKSADKEANSADKEGGQGAQKAPEKEGAAAPAKPPGAATGPLRISVQDAVLMAMEHNQALAVERLTPEITRTFEGEERGVFDPVLAATASDAKTSTLRQRRQMWLEDLARVYQDLNNIQAQATDTLGNPGGANFYQGLSDDLAQVGRQFRNRNAELAPQISNVILAQFSASEFFPTGTTVALDLSTVSTDRSFYEPQVQSRLGMSVTQPLLRGAGRQVNLARLRQARIDTLSSQYQLRGFAETLDSQVEQAYWDYVLALRQEAIYTEGLALAGKQLKGVDDRIRAGVVAESDRAAAESEVALRRQNVIDAQSFRTTRRLRLLRLLNPQGDDMWSRQVEVQVAGELPKEELADVNSAVQTALRLRPDLNQARLLVQRDELEVVRTKNGLLPQLDLFFTVGKSGYAESIAGSWRHLDETGYDLLFGMTASYPVGNHAAEALYQRAKASKQQAMEAVNNLAQLIQEDVRSAYVEVDRARQQVEATQTTRKAMGRTLQAELGKYDLGKSTYLMVGRAERDVVAAQIAEAAAVAAYRKALVVLYHLEGSLLQRRGIIAPGREPVELTKQRK